METIEKILDLLYVKTALKKLNWDRSPFLLAGTQSFVGSISSASFTVVSGLGDDYSLNVYNDQGEVVESVTTNPDSMLYPNLKALFFAARNSALHTEQTLTDIKAALEAL